MTIAALATFITPFIPFLVKGGEAAAEEAGKKFGNSAWEKATEIWSILFPKIASKPSANEVVNDIAETPEDEDLQPSLRYQLKKLLAEDEALVNKLEQLMQEDSMEETNGDNITQKIFGDKNKAVGKIEANKVDFKM